MASLSEYDWLPSDRRGTRRTFAILLATTLCAFLILVAIFWVGFLGSDDVAYWDGATRWSTQFPYVGTSHWTLRHTLVIPMAFSRLLLGDGLAAMALPSLLYALGVIVVLAIWTQSAAGIRSAIAVLILVITCPQFVLLASTADVDIPELFFVVSAFFALERAIRSEAGRISADEGSSRPIDHSAAWPRLLIAGALLALAMMSRETAVLAIATIGVLFLAGYGMERRFYLVIGIGFAAIAGLELAYLWGMTGQPFYRFNIALHHDNGIDRWSDQGAAIPFVHPLIDPVTMLLLNHYFALLAWIGVPLSVWLVVSASRVNAATRRLIVLLGTLALTWTILAAGLWRLLTLIPRYYLLPSVGVSVLSGIALAQLWEQGRRRWAAVLGGLLVAANLFALSVDNRNYMFGEVTLANLASRSTGMIHTDPLTLRRADLLLEWQKTRGRVTSTLPANGDLFFYNPARADSNTSVGPNWTVVARYNVPANRVQWLACHLLPIHALPKAFLAGHRCEPSSVILYRVL